MGILDGMKPTGEPIGCKVWKIRQTLEPADQKLWDAMIGDDFTWKAETLSKQLNGRGITIGAATIRLHRDKACLCRNLE